MAAIVCVYNCYHAGPGSSLQDYIRQYTIYGNIPYMAIYHKLCWHIKQAHVTMSVPVECVTDRSTPLFDCCV